MSAPPCTPDWAEVEAQSIIDWMTPHPRRRLVDSSRVFVNPPYDLVGVRTDATIIDDPHDPESARETVRRETAAAWADARGNVR